jgi:uncharacterized protein (TIGR02448 family)
MNKYLLSLATAACLVAGNASAGSITATLDSLGASLVNTVEGTSNATSNLGDNKLVRDAKDDAARFVASDGTTRGAQLEAALQHIRSEAPSLQASDLQLASAILAL